MVFYYPIAKEKVRVYACSLCSLTLLLTGFIEDKVLQLELLHLVVNAQMNNFIFALVAKTKYYAAVVPCVVRL
jgi:hypothetical protein